MLIANGSLYNHYKISINNLYLYLYLYMIPSPAGTINITIVNNVYTFSFF